ncbi:MAG: hypothetical protein ACLPM3_09080 [Terracidiphilus sp.]
MKTMTDKQAYAAMFHFLKQLYERTKSDDLGGFLGGMCMLQDGKTADPAVLHDWDEAVEYALKGGGPDSLQLH